MRAWQRAVAVGLSAASVSLGLAVPASAAKVPVKSVNILFTEHVATPTLDFLQSRAQANADFVKSMGANSVTINFRVFTSSFSSNKVYAGTNPSDGTTRTPTPDELAAAITVFQNDGLKVTLRPLLDESIMRPQHWRGTIAPLNRAGWFRSYFSTIKPYLQIAQTLNVNGFVIQTELQSLASDPHWNSLIAESKFVYSAGSLVWNPVMAPGTTGLIAHSGTSTSMDLYPSINLPDTAKVSQLVAGWDKWWASQTPPADPRKVTIGEVHIVAQDGGFYKTPWMWSGSGAFDQVIQSKWLTAACQFSREHHFAGIGFWFLGMFNPPPSLTVPNTLDPGALQPQGLAAIQSCFDG